MHGQTGIDIKSLAGNNIAAAPAVAKFRTEA
jgi:hypothetical protein